MALKPFVQWAGGKTRITKYLLPLIPKEYGTYHEPFVGGGALFLTLQPKKAVINDSCRPLINCYEQIRKNPDKLCDEITHYERAYPDTQEQYNFLKACFNNGVKFGEFDEDCAALMLVLNRRCFNGLYRTNGRGEFNTSWGRVSHGKTDQVNLTNIMALSEYFNKADIRFTCKDFGEICWDIQEGDFVFFDSPYVPMSETANFTGYTGKGFGMNEHQKLAVIYKYVSRIGAKAILTNNDTELVREWYRDYRIMPINTLRSINCKGNKRRTGKEVIVVNYKEETSDSD